MVKFTVLYPNTPGAWFDHDYYRDSHMPMLKQLVGDKVKRYTIDRGLAGGEPGEPAPYMASCDVFFDSLQDLQQAMAPHRSKIRADLPNYTDQKPVIQISEVVQG